eukprot:GEMP01024270.1.p1 GENE.GEMP01024270.1~~GEMP01024270.1.p1  ORF type:complete len:459 (+),score=61.95 GEMP01024270.1:71-1378(+)
MTSGRSARYNYSHRTERMRRRSARKTGKRERYRSHARSKHRHHYHSRSRTKHTRRRSRTKIKQHSVASPSSGSESSIVHFKWKPYMELMDGMSVLDQLGEGTFGRVLLVDYKGRKEAVKVIRDVPRYREDADIEHDVLQKIIDHLQCNGDRVNRGHRRLVRYKGCFDTNTSPPHTCLAFEPLGPSLYSVMKENRHQGFFMEDIVVFAKQGMEALDFLDSIDLSHTDLKPENLLLKYTGLEPVAFPRRTRDGGGQYKRPKHADIKLIDFGGATFKHDHHSTTISTRQYRAPEVLIEAGWDQAADVFSFGCILMELYTGKLVLQTHDCREHLHLVERVIDRIPTSDLTGASTSVKETYLRQSRHDGRWYLPRPEDDSQLDRHAKEAVRRAVPLMELTCSRHRPFAAFVFELLTITPRRRIRPHAAIEHQFFRSMLPE